MSIKFKVRVGSAPTQQPTITPTAWVRNSNWPAMPSVLSSEEKVVCLLAITRGDDNYMSLQVQGDFTVDWGDGTVTNYSSNTQASHYYNYNTISGSTFNNGTKSVFITITPQEGQNLTYVDLSRWVDGDSGHTDSWTNQVLEVKLSVPNATRVWFTNPAYYYYMGHFIQAVTFVGQPSTSLAMDNLFRNMQGLRYVSIDTTGNTSTDWSGMFWDCNILTNVDDVIFDTVNATNMTYMFAGAISLLKVPLFNTSNVTVASGMFQSCRSLQTVPAYNFSNATDLNSLFYECRSMTTIPALNTGQNTNFGNFFRECWALKSLPEMDTSSGIYFDTMCQNDYSLTYVPTYNTANAISMYCTFQNCVSLQTIPLLNTINVTNFGGLLDSCRSLISVPEFNTSNGTLLNSFVSNCQRIESIPTFDTSKATNLQYFVAACWNLKSFPTCNTASAISIDYMFSDCRALTEIPVLNTQNVLGMQQVFDACRNLLKFPEWDTSKVQNIQNFTNGTLLHELPSWNVSAVASDSYMYFEGMKKRASYSGLYGGRYQVLYRDNLYSANALNTIFTNLGIPANDSTKLIYIGNNPGSSNCNTAIATSKGWTIVN